MMDRFRETFDLRSAMFGALLMGSIVWYINAAHGSFLATTAALKQASYTFFMGGLITRFCERLAMRPGPAALALAAAVILPCIITTGATFFVHSLKGTPEPVASTIPVAVISLPTFTVWAWKSRRGASDAADQDCQAATTIVDRVLEER